MQITASVFINAMGTYHREREEKKIDKLSSIWLFFCKIIAISKDVPLSFANEEKREEHKREMERGKCYNLKAFKDEFPQKNS